MHDCKQPQFTEKDIPDLTGRVIIVTGGERTHFCLQWHSKTNLLPGNSGIGFETALHLALHNARVYIGSRSEERVTQAIDEMRRAAGEKQLDLQFLQIDLKDLKSVKSAAAAFKAREPRLDVLINNAGVCVPSFDALLDSH